MIAIGHTASGVIVGSGLITTLGNTSPWYIGFAFLAGILMHYVGDALPHGHYAFNLRTQRFRSFMLLAFDLVVPFLVFTMLALITHGWGMAFFMIIAAMIGANAPDVFEELVNLGVLRPTSLGSTHRQFHYNVLHWHNDPTSPLPNGARQLGWTDSYLVVFVTVAVVTI